VIELTLYSRRDCHLCEEMKERIEAEAGGFPARLTVVDVDSRAELAAEYGDDVPVLFVDGRKFAKHRLERGRLREKLRRARRSPAEARA
jgi:thioredoxin reductase (NADPH)